MCTDASTSGLRKFNPNPTYFQVGIQKTKRGRLMNEQYQQKILTRETRQYKTQRWQINEGIKNDQFTYFWAYFLAYTIHKSTQVTPTRSIHHAESEPLMDKLRKCIIVEASISNDWLFKFLKSFYAFQFQINRFNTTLHLNNNEKLDFIIKHGRVKMTTPQVKC